MRKLRVFGIALIALVAVFAVVAVLLKKEPPAVGAQAGAGPEIILYSGEAFSGRSLSVTGTLYDMPKLSDAAGEVWDWNDQVRSFVVVSGTWRLYQNGRCNTAIDETPLESLQVRTKAAADGWSGLVSATSAGSLEVPFPGAIGLGPDISSIELISSANLPDWTFAFRN
jgi:hypothetical protein